MSRLAGVHLSALKFGKFGHLKDGFQSCLAQSNPQGSVNLQPIKNRIHNSVFSHYSQDFENVTPCCLGDINFQVFSEPFSWTLLGGLQRPPKFPTVSSLAWLSRSLFGQNPWAPHKFHPVYLWTWLLLFSVLF